MFRGSLCVDMSQVIDGIFVGVVGIFRYIFFVLSFPFISVDLIFVVVIAVVVFYYLLQKLIWICYLPVSVMSVVTYSSCLVWIIFVAQLQQQQKILFASFSSIRYR